LEVVVQDLLVTLLLMLGVEMVEILPLVLLSMLPVEVVVVQLYLLSNQVILVDLVVVVETTLQEVMLLVELDNNIIQIHQDILDLLLVVDILVVRVILEVVKNQVEVAVVLDKQVQMPLLHQRVDLVVMEFKLLQFSETLIIHMVRELSTSVVVEEEVVDMVPHPQQHQVELEVEETVEQMQEIMLIQAM
tara:strand:- start:178 stop:747 length:570 start_codon:yes stop_codon:yes gene_type:complete